MRVVVDANPLFPLSPVLGPTGVGRWTAGAVSSLARAAPDWQIDLVAFHLTRAELDVSWMGPNVSFSLRRFSNRAHRQMMVLGVVPRLERFVGDADAMLGPAFVAWPSRNMAEIPVIHDLSYIRFPQFVSRRNLWYMRAIVPRVVRRAARVITVSDAMKSEIEQTFRLPSERISIVPNGTDLATFSPDAPPSGVAAIPDDYILFVGTLEPRKNLKGSLAAYEILKREHPGAPPLVLVGGMGWRNEGFQELVDAYPHKDDLILPGYVPDDALPGIYARARCLLFPSLYEGFGLPALEAMASGTPVVASDRGGLGEVIGDAGVLVDPDDASSIASGLARVLTDPQSISEMRSKGLRRAKAYTWDRAGSALKEAIEDAVAAKKA